MTVKYKTVITKAGAIKLAAATVPNGKKVNFTAMAIGDGGGTLPTPDPNQTKLINEVWRYSLNKISQDAKNKNYVVAELLIPPERGGFWMREMGLYDDTGTLIAVGNMAESYKPALAEGSGRAQTVRMVIMVSDIASVELTIDTSMVMATQDYVDDRLAEHEESRRHPDASLTEKGFTQLSSATDSTSESVAATPKAVKAVRDIADGKYTAQDATTARKGIVQLSSATDSSSESVAATPKAIKAVRDIADGKYTAQDATTARKGIVQLSSATDSTSEVLAATPKAVKAVSDAVAEVKKTLGTAAGKDITTSNYDTTAGRVLKVGDFGLGTSAGLKLLNSIFDITCSGKYTALGAGAGSTATQGMPVNSGNTRFSVEVDNVYTGQYWVTLRSTSQTYTGLVNTANNTASWSQHYTELYKPTASDVDAVSASQGGTFQKPVQFNQPAYFAQGLKLANSDIHAAIGYGADAASFENANLLLKSWYGIGFYSTYPSSGELGVVGFVDVRLGRLQMKEQIIPGNYANFDGRYYTRTIADATFQPKGSYGKPDSYKVSGNILWTKNGDTNAIRMTGKVGTTNGGARITFPFAFASKCYSIHLNAVASSGAGTALAYYNEDTTGFNLQIAGGGAVAFAWTAEGI